MEDQITSFKSKKDLPLSVQKEKGGIAKIFVLEKVLKKEMGLYSCKKAYNFRKVPRLALLLGELKDLHYTPKKIIAALHIPSSVPGGFLTVLCSERSLSEYAQMHVMGLLSLRPNKKAMSCTVCPALFSSSEI